MVKVSMLPHYCICDTFRKIKLDIKIEVKRFYLEYNYGGRKF